MGMDIRKVSIEFVKPWAENPRNIKTADFGRLKRQIQDLGIYKPLICVEENGGFITLGGNMRIRALLELGHKDVEISVVRAETKAEKIKYALSDNDRAGEYLEDKLAELVYPHFEEINLEDYKIDLGKAVNLKNIIEQYGPGGNQLDNLIKLPDLPQIPEDKLIWLANFEYIFVEFSGGKDSLLALYWTKKACEIIGKSFEALFVETGAEFPDLIAYILRLAKAQGFNLRILHATENIIAHYIQKGKWPDPIYRDCQHMFINDVIEKTIDNTDPVKVLKIRGGRPDQIISRTRRSSVHLSSKGLSYSPYFKTSKDEYEELLKKAEGLLWPGYVRGFKRTACWMCPFQGKSKSSPQWEALQTCYPMLWEEMRILAMTLKFPRHSGDNNIDYFYNYWNKYR